MFVLVFPNLALLDHVDDLVGQGFNFQVDLVVLVR
jgi:hypothetical protein